MRNYKELLEKTVKSPIGQVYVAEIDRNKGCTFYKVSSNEKAYCLNRSDFDQNPEAYDKIFDKIVNCIEQDQDLPLFTINPHTGLFQYYKDLDTFYDNVVNMSSCAFE